MAPPTDPDPESGDGPPPTAAESRPRDPATVRRTYDRIADHFAKTRHSPWPEVREFLAGTDGEVGVDLGCGNGRHAALLADHVRRVVPADASRGLLSIARDRLVDDGEANGATVDPVQADAARLPLRAGRVDLALYVATLHHLPDREARVASLDELARVLAPGGRALVSAWSTTHDRFDREAGFDTTVDWTLPGGETVPRFYHVYDPDEFRADLADSDLSVHDVRVSSGNCYGVVGPPGSGD